MVKGDIRFYFELSYSTQRPGRPRRHYAACLLTFWIADVPEA